MKNIPLLLIPLLLASCSKKEEKEVEEGSHRQSATRLPATP